jgi:hypothetical protein
LTSWSWFLSSDLASATKGEAGGGVKVAEDILFN